MITQDQIKQLQEVYNIHILTLIDDDTFKNSFWIRNGIKSKTIYMPKNLDNVTYEWLNDKISNYLNATSKNLRSVFSKLNIQGNIYYTSFGFSYDCFMKNRTTFDTETQLLKTTLDNMGITYTNEFSDAYWVYRFKISQSKDNLSKIIAL